MYLREGERFWGRGGERNGEGLVEGFEGFWGEGWGRGRLFWDLVVGRREGAGAGAGAGRCLGILEEAHFLFPLDSLFFSRE